MSSEQQPIQKKDPDNQEGGIYDLEKPERVQGVKVLQSPTTYIGSIIVAFVVYHMNRLDLFTKGIDYISQPFFQARKCINEKYTWV